MKDLNWGTKITLSVLAIFGIIATGFLTVKFGAISILVLPAFFLFIALIFQIFRDPFWGFSAIVFFLPFERVPTYNLGGVDLRINTVLGFTALLAWVLALLFNGKKWKTQPSAIGIPLLIFVGVMAVSLTQAGNLGRAFEVMVFILFTMAISVLAVNMIATRDDLLKIINVLFVSSLVVGLFGLFQFGGDIIGLPTSITFLKQDYTSAVFGFPRIQAFSMEPLYFANYLLIPISLGLAYFFAKREEIWNRWIVAGLSVLLLINFILALSRGAYLGLAASLLALAVLQFKQIFTWKHILVGALAIFIVGYGVAFALSRGDARATNEFIAHVLVKDYSNGESVQGRLLAFDVALDAYRKNPVLGVGIGNYGPFVKSYPMMTPPAGWPIVNNEYLEILAETGIVGLASFILIILVLIWQSLRAIIQSHDQFLRVTMIGLLAAFIGVLAQFASFSTLYIIHIWVLIGLMIATQNLIFRKEQS